MTKTADAVVQTARQAAAARARGATAGELTALSTPLVHVRADGAVEVVLHADRVVGSAELDDLRRLDVDIVSTSTTPSIPGQPAVSVVQGWVLPERLAALSALAWVAAITPPAYPGTDTGG